MELQLFDPRTVAKQSDEMEFQDLCQFGDGGGGVFWSSEGGPSPWEMHPDCDELLHVIDGEIEVEVLPSNGDAAVSVTIKSGCYLVVPKGCWHRQYLRKRSTEFYLTPGRTLHSHSADPRLDG